ncbi:MAG: DNA polymerase III subunit beta [Verrucomicrobiae bacterium]|nr:DNA polymerase III subunit beta [Verrucomicrobiae bacterium]
MKFTVSKEAFIESLQKVQSVVTSKTTLPILSNVLISVVNNVIELTTTDLDLGVRCQMQGEIESPGAVTLPVRRLFSIVRELPDSELTLEVDDKNMASIRCGQSYFKIVGIAADEFPPFPKLEGARVFKVLQNQFRSVLKKTSYAISTDETRYVLNGVLMSFKENKLTVVATDGRRLALVDHEMEFPKSSEGDFILPTKAVNELGRLLSDKDEELKISISENQISFFIGQTTLVTKLIEGTYPNYRQVIPSEPKERITLERESFMAAVHRVSLLTNDKSNSIKLSFGKNNLLITANTPDVGESKENLPINYKGKDVTIAFNPAFLLDPLRNVDNDTVTMDLIDELSPGVIRNNEPFLYVIMPMRQSS